MPTTEQSYCELLRSSARRVGNNICLGLDPQWQKLPADLRKLEVAFDTGKHRAPLFDTQAIQEFLQRSLGSLLERGLSPAAFKPNLGYFQALDRPLLAHTQYAQYAFGGSRLLAWLLRFLAEHFAGIPVILDFKKGDIGRSSANYAQEGFVLWGVEALTVSPYMGWDSVAPFGRQQTQHFDWLSCTHSEGEEGDGGLEGNLASLSCGLPCGEGGVYSLLRTSNPGASDLQNAPLAHDTTESGPVAAKVNKATRPLFLALAQTLLRWRTNCDIPGLGAVVGATSIRELGQLAQFFADEDFPLLIPGVGGQGGSYPAVQDSLRRAGYPTELARVNLSGGLLQNWRGEAPPDWPCIIARTLDELLRS